MLINYLIGAVGNEINADLTAAGYNLRVFKKNQETDSLANFCYY